MTDKNADELLRYQRQMIFPPFGLAGQRSVMASRVLVVGVGGLGSWSAELLARAGVGLLRLVDADAVDLTNVHRQAMYDESDAAAGRAKVIAAARHLNGVNSSVTVEPIVARLDNGNVGSLGDRIDLIIDGTDNFATRYIINDFAVKTGKPWVFAGVVGAEAQMMPIVPGRTACLRCIHESPPPPCADPNCRSAGVLGPAVAAVAAMQAGEALKILAGHEDDVSPYLLKIDLWANTVQRIDAAAASADLECPCCKQGHFDFLAD